MAILGWRSQRCVDVRVVLWLGYDLTWCILVYVFIPVVYVFLIPRFWLSDPFHIYQIDMLAADSMHQKRSLLQQNRCSHETSSHDLSKPCEEQAPRFKPKALGSSHLDATKQCLQSTFEIDCRLNYAGPYTMSRKKQSNCMVGITAVVDLGLHCNTPICIRLEGTPSAHVVNHDNLIPIYTKYGLGTVNIR